MNLKYLENGKDNGFHEYEISSLTLYAKCVVIFGSIHNDMWKMTFT